jgi:hypothetical protein
MANRDFEMDTQGFGVGAISLVSLYASALVGGAFEGLARARAQAQDDDAVEAVQSWMVAYGELLELFRQEQAKVARLEGDLRTVGGVLKRTYEELSRRPH